jgi:hypothetical protein
VCVDLGFEDKANWADRWRNLAACGYRYGGKDWWGLLSGLVLF